MRAPKRRRPPRRSLDVAPPGVDLVRVAGLVSYVGSPEHKTYPSFAGKPNPRADATKYDPNLNNPVELTEWLRAGVRAGYVGAPWEGDFPRYVWCKRDEVVYEGRLVNREQGHYKGWALKVEEWPKGVQ